MSKKQLLALAGFAGIFGLVLTAPAANAVTVVFSYSDGGGATTSTAPASGTLVNSGTINTANWNFSATASSGPGTEGTNSFNVSSNSGGTLYLFAVFSGITAPLGNPQGFLSNFTLNSVIGGSASVLMASYVDSSNSSSVANTGSIPGTLLGSATLSTLTTASIGGSGNTGAGPYSIIEEFAITSLGGVTTQATANVAATPLPAALPLMAGGLGVMGLFVRRKKRTAATAC